MSPLFFVCVVLAMALVCLSRAGVGASGSSCCHGRDLTCAELVSFFYIVWICVACVRVALLAARMYCLWSTFFCIHA